MSIYSDRDNEIIFFNNLVAYGFICNDKSTQKFFDEKIRHLSYIQKMRKKPPLTSNRIYKNLTPKEISEINFSKTTSLLEDYGMDAVKYMAIPEEQIQDYINKNGKMLSKNKNPLFLVKTF